MASLGAAPRPLQAPVCQLPGRGKGPIFALQRAAGRWAGSRIVWRRAWLGLQAVVKALRFRLQGPAEQQGYAPVASACALCQLSGWAKNPFLSCAAQTCRDEDFLHLPAWQEDKVSIWAAGTCSKGVAHIKGVGMQHDAVLSRAPAGPR